MRRCIYIFAGLLFAVSLAVHADDKEIKGEIGCAECAFKSAEKCAPAVKVDGKVYLIEADPGADEKTKKAVAECASCKDAVKVTIRVKNPESKDKWLVVSLVENK